MDQRKFGDILREERKRKGLTLVQTAERLRIRPDILQTIENSDIPNMPPRGYARNMVMGYAKFVGLDPAELGAIYNEEFAHYENTYGRTQAMPAYRESGRSAVREPRAARRAREAREGYAPAAGTYAADRTQRMPQIEGDSDIISSRNSYDRQDLNSRRSRFQDDGFRSSNSFDDTDDYLDYEDENRNPLQAISGFFSGLVSRIRGGNSDDAIYAGSADTARNPALLASIAAALVVLIVLVLLLGRGCSGKADQGTTVPVSQDTNAAQNDTAKAPTSFKFEYKIDEGAEAWIEVYIDGQQQVAEQVTGPKSGSFDVTGEIEFVTATTEGVHVYVDGVEQELKTNENGLVDLTFKFSDILNKWNKDHGLPAADTTNSSSSSTSTSNDSQSNDTNDPATNDQSSYDGYTGDQTGGTETYQPTDPGTATTGGY